MLGCKAGGGGGEGGKDCVTYSGTASATKETGWKLVLESFSFSALLTFKIKILQNSFET